MAVVQSSGLKQTDNFASGPTYNAASNFTAGNTVIITLVHYGAGTTNRVTGITVSGTAAVKDSEVSDSGNTNHCEIWRATNIAGGSTTVAITVTAGSGQYLSCGFEEWDNITTSSPLDQIGSTGNTTSSSPSVTSASATTQADEVVYAAFLDYVGTNWTSSTPPGSYTESWEEPNGTAHEAGSAAYRVVAATGSQTATFTTGSSMSWIAVMATYKLGSDTTAPTLTSPTGTSTGTTTAQGQVTTDEANGTMYAVVSTSATPPSVAQIQAGNDSTGSAGAWSGNQAISSTGTKTFNATGLTASTSYYFYFQHRDAAANDSTVASSSQFTTDAPAAGYVTAWLRA